MTRAILVHGGAGTWARADRRAVRAGMRSACRRGRAVLEAGGSALDAAVAAVVALEDDPAFNAGTGSVLNRDGEAELDASVMSGAELAAGGVACLRRVRNPILVARQVMERTPHVLLAGEGALRFARAQGHADHDPATADARAARARRAAAPGAEADGDGRGGTVGAVALDAAGRLAAATSTGGIDGKLPGRIGDSPIPGAGNYATVWAAVSATGHGELMMRHLAAKRICDLVAAGLSAQAACERFAGGVAGEYGLIALDRSGGFGVLCRSAALPCARWRDGERDVAVEFEH
jgi:beta-aspartyl-peptidase (threonine type)